MAPDASASDPTLSRRALGGLAWFMVVLAAVLFMAAWTFRFWQAWIYLAMFGACVLAITEYFLKHDPGLVTRRMRAGPAAETERSQQRIQVAASVMLLALFVVAGLDHRLGWSPAISTWLSLAANAFAAVGFFVMYLTFRENSYAASTIAVEAGQHVISTGPYRIVRHPMYLGAMLLFFATAPALGSWWALLPAAGLSLTMVVRLLDEERYLAAHLPGYVEYTQTVKARLVPLLW